MRARVVPHAPAPMTAIRSVTRPRIAPRSAGRGPRARARGRSRRRGPGAGDGSASRRTERVAQRFSVPPIREVEQLRVVHEDDERRRRTATWVAYRTARAAPRGGGGGARPRRRRSPGSRRRWAPGGSAPRPPGAPRAGFAPPAARSWPTRTRCPPTPGTARRGEASAATVAVCSSFSMTSHLLMTRTRPLPASSVSHDVGVLGGEALGRIGQDDRDIGPVDGLQAAQDAVLLGAGVMLPGGGCRRCRSGSAARRRP